MFLFTAESLLISTLNQNNSEAQCFFIVMWYVIFPNKDNLVKRLIPRQFPLLIHHVLHSIFLWSWVILELRKHTRAVECRRQFRKCRRSTIFYLWKITVFVTWRRIVWQVLFGLRHWVVCHLKCQSKVRYYRDYLKYGIKERSS